MDLTSVSLAIVLLGISICAIIAHEWSRKAQFDPFSGIVLISGYIFFELVVTPLVRLDKAPEHQGQHSIHANRTP